MTFKDWWKSKPYWLKGGIIGLLLTAILQTIYLITLGFDELPLAFPFEISYGYIRIIIEVLHINYFATWFMVLCTLMFWFLFSSIIAIIIDKMNKFIEMNFPKFFYNNKSWAKYFFFNS